MDLIFFGITVPIFYIIGLVVFIKWLIRGGGSAERHLRKRIAADLRRQADSSHGVSRDALYQAAEQVFAGQLGASRPPVAPPLGAQPATTPSTSSGIPVRPAPGHSGWNSMDVSDALHSLDNINLLLYLGAFLVVVSAGIFVGYNFSTLSGVFKTSFLGLFAAVFYVTGLLLFLRAPKLRPAGTTFTGIGLVLVPLVGVAAYNFTSAHNHGPALWFATSLITLVLYAFTLSTTRQTYVAYLMAFTTLSLFESAVSLVQLPLYWFGWGMGIVAIMLEMLARWRGWWNEASGSLIFCANIFVPLSLFLTLFVPSGSWPTPLGVTFGLAGLFYALMSSRFHDHTYGSAYWLATLVCFPAALGLGLWNSLGGPTVSVILCAVAVAYLVFDWGFAAHLDRTRRELLGLVAALLPVFSAITATDQPGRLSLYLLVCIAVSAAFAVRLKEPALALIAILAALFEPFVVLHQIVHPQLGAAWIATGYVALAGLLFGWRRLIGAWNNSSRVVGIVGYLLALSLTVIAATISGSLALLSLGVIVSAALYWLSGYEGLPEFMYPASAVKYLAATQVVRLIHLPSGAYAAVIIVVGSASYAVGHYLTDIERGRALRYSAIMATLFGATFGLSGDPLAPIASLALGGGLLWFEAKHQEKPNIQDVAGGIIILALNWFLAHENVTNIQIHAWPWALYAAYLGYRRRARGHDAYDVYVAIAMAIITFTIAGQALADNGQLYGLELIAIGLALVFAGAALRYRLVQWWGAGTLILEVLYQIRNLLFALPKYLISAALGLVLLGVAIVLLQRRRQN